MRIEITGTPIGRIVRVLVAASVAVVCVAVVNAHAGPVVNWPTRGWPQGTPASAGLDERTLLGLDADIAAGKYGLIDSVQVFRCGAEVFERKYPHDYASIYGKEARTRGPLNARLTGRYNYFDPAWHPYYHGTDLHTMQSVSKTVTSVIFGIATQRGEFKASLSTPVLKYFDVAKVKNVDDRKRRMTLRDVLTMSTGLDWREDVPYDDPRSDSSLMEATDDWVQYVIDKPMAKDPGTAFNYSSGATELLAYIFRKETGQDIEVYGGKHLFGPLGIKYHWKRTYLGVVDTEGGLYLTGADLAKIGYLYLNDGTWDGTRIVSKDWVKQSLTAFVDTGWQGLKYGFKWWLYPRKRGGQFVWMGIGFGGQRLMVFPEEQLIATFTGWDIIKDPTVDVELVDRLLPAITAETCRDGAH
ncbi:MAG TPA: serine hydrolase [Steroidobacteraceae bacterium]|jgi:CubicO group peptidase (beta-lactamase class C family)|nr:serine hydrolase [Steroidobacteraceae bacterium]